MDFSLNDDHIALQDAVRRFCDGEYPAPERGNPESDELAARRWTAMAELGLLGLPFDSEVGGSGQTAVELMLVAQELGRSLGGGAWLPCVVQAGQLLAKGGTPAQRDRWLPAIVSGEKTLALAFAERNSRYRLASPGTRVAETRGGLRIDGHKTLVLAGDSADGFVVTAAREGATADSVCLLLVEATAPGVEVEAFRTLDGRRAAQVSFDGVVVGTDAVVGPADAALPLLEEAIDRANAAMCAEAAGAIETLIDLTAEHLKTRKQFGMALAGFQVLQHRMADMLIAFEQVKSMACAAAMAVDEADLVARRRLVSAAKVITAQAGREVGQWAIQLHGAMGMTDESRVGHYVKRLLVINQLMGDARHHLQRLADQPQA